LWFEGIPVLLSGFCGSRRWVFRSAQVGALAFFLAGGAFLSKWTEAPDPKGQGSRIERVHLPQEAHVTLGLIRSGGPFPYEKDGSVFANREKLLPGKPRGFYREYTVPTPASIDRGARRIVCGGSQPRTPEACFYSSDHYASFGLIVQ
jgi:ribonuclease T1